jgi:DNA-binding response OmpR family regulator
VKTPVSRQPIDIEQLQQRVDVLERRIRERARANGSQLPVRDLEQLKQRMKLLERSVHNELWAARQREHSLLELLARPPLKQLIRKHVKRLHSGALHATRRWSATLGQLNQPLWWPHFARAWQESLDKARGNHNN